MNDYEYHPEWDSTSPGPSGIAPLNDQTVDLLLKKAVSYETNSSLSEVKQVHYLLGCKVHRRHVVVVKDYGMFLPRKWSRWFMLSINQYGVVTKVRLRGSDKHHAYVAVTHGAANLHHGTQPGDHGE